MAADVVSCLSDYEGLESSNMVRIVCQ